MDSTANGVNVPAPKSHHFTGNLLEGIHFQFPHFKHDHPRVVNVNSELDDQMTMGDRVADKVASTVGSWPFILTQSFILLCWLTLNSLAWAYRWDVYPFILLNLALSFQAAYAAPFVMMSQNRQSAKDRLMAENDYHTNCKGEEEIRHVMEHLDHQDTLILDIVKRLELQREELLHRLSELDPTTFSRLAEDVHQIATEEDQALIEERHAQHPDGSL